MRMEPIKREESVPGGPATVRRAVAADVEEIMTLTNRMAQKGLMLPRSKYKIVTTLSSFFVALMPQQPGREGAGENIEIAASGAFIPLWTDMGEIMSLAVKEQYQGMGVGKQLVRALIEEGRRMGMPEIITLTYQIEFFRNLGFPVADKDSFPRKLWRECLECPKLETCDETAMHLLLT